MKAAYILLLTISAAGLMYSQSADRADKSSHLGVTNAVPSHGPRPNRVSVLSQRSVAEFSPRSGRQNVAHGVSRGSTHQPHPPSPLSRSGGRGGRKGGEGVDPQGFRPGLLPYAPSGAAEDPACRRGAFVAEPVTQNGRIAGLSGQQLKDARGRRSGPAIVSGAMSATPTTAAISGTTMKHKP